MAELDDITLVADTLAKMFCFETPSEWRPEAEKILTALREAGRMLPATVETREELGAMQLDGHVTPLAATTRADLAINPKYLRVHTVSTLADGGVLTGPWREVKPDADS